MTNDWDYWLAQLEGYKALEKKIRDYMKNKKGQAKKPSKSKTDKA